MKAAVAAVAVALVLVAGAGGRTAPETCDQDVADALAWMSTARTSHVVWADVSEWYPEEQRRLVGDRAWHELWVGRYDVVLKVIKRGCGL